MSDRIMIAGTGSGCGKTSVVCGLIDALCKMKRQVVSFKCGPDYVDPIFHKSVMGINCYNLDVFLSGENGVRSLLSGKSDGFDIAVIEGVMGFYDGVMSDNFKGSSFHISNLTDTNVILVVNCKGKSASVVAEIKGYMELSPNNIKGVILNQATSGTFDYYKNIIEKYLNVKVLGYLPYNVEFLLSERKLGLRIEESDLVREKIGLLGDTVLQTVDMEEVIQIAQNSSTLSKTVSIDFRNRNVKIAVADDEAFTFYYSYNRELMKDMGAEIVLFSPLNDDKLPSDVSGLIIGSGFVTDYVARLSQNKSLLWDIKEKLLSGMPAIVEGAGNILLCGEYVDGERNSFEFSGIVNGTLKQTDRPPHFGYHYISANRDNLICGKEQVLPVHEFIYIDEENVGDGFFAYKPSRNAKRQCIHSTPSLYAGMPYIYFCGNEFVLENFLDKCEEYKKG